MYRNRAERCSIPSSERWKNVKKNTGVYLLVCEIFGLRKFNIYNSLIISVLFVKIILTLDFV